jgi:hypothetical protein
MCSSVALVKKTWVISAASVDERSLRRASSIAAGRDGSMISVMSFPVMRVVVAWPVLTPAGSCHSGWEDKAPIEITRAVGIMAGTVPQDALGMLLECFKSS